MRGLGPALLLVVLGAVIALWRTGLDAVDTQAQAFASEQIKAAQNLLGFREEIRLRNVQRFAGELAGKQELKDFFLIGKKEGLAQALAGTSFGNVMPNVVLLSRRGHRVWAMGAEATGEVTLPAIVRALNGQPELLMLQPDDPALLELGLPRQDAPALIVIAPLTDGKDVPGAVVVVEPMGPEFFQHLGLMTNVRLSFAGAAANYGTAPLEVVGLPPGPPAIIKAERGLVIGQRLEFRVPPSYVLGEAFAAVDGSGLADRRRALNLFFAGAVGAIVLAMLAVLRRR